MTDKQIQSLYKDIQAKYRTTLHKRFPIPELLFAPVEVDNTHKVNGVEIGDIRFYMNTPGIPGMNWVDTIIGVNGAILVLYKDQPDEGIYQSLAHGLGLSFAFSLNKCEPIEIGEEDHFLEIGYHLWYQFVGEYCAYLALGLGGETVAGMAEDIEMETQEIRMECPGKLSNASAYLVLVLMTKEAKYSWREFREVLEDNEYPFIDMIHVAWDQVQKKEFWNADRDFLACLGASFMYEMAKVGMEQMYPEITDSL